MLGILTFCTLILVGFLALALFRMPVQGKEDREPITAKSWSVVPKEDQTAQDTEPCPPPDDAVSDWPYQHLGFDLLTDTVPTPQNPVECRYVARVLRAQAKTEEEGGWSKDAEASRIKADLYDEIADRIEARL